MTPETLLASAKALIEANPSAAGLIDRCTVKRVMPSAADSYGGTTTVETTVASAVPILYEERTYQRSRVRGEQSEASVTHNLFLIADADTRLIGANYKIIVTARGDIPELTFVEPIRLDESLGPLVALGAVLQV